MMRTVGDWFLLAGNGIELSSVFSQCCLSDRNGIWPLENLNHLSPNSLSEQTKIKIKMRRQPSNAGLTEKWLLCRSECVQILHQIFYVNLHSNKNSINAKFQYDCKVLIWVTSLKKWNVFQCCHFKNLHNRHTMYILYVLVLSGWLHLGTAAELLLALQSAPPYPASCQQKYSPQQHL